MPYIPLNPSLGRFPQDGELETITTRGVLPRLRLPQPTGISRPSAGDIIRTSPRPTIPPRVNINTGAAYRHLAPLYGATRVVGYPGLIREKSGAWVVLYVLGRGPWENIDTLYINNDSGTDVSSNSGGATFTNAALFGSGGSARIFEGTSGQNVGSGFMTAFVAAFVDALNDPGVVCIGMELSPLVHREPPRIEADCQGYNQIFDPRTSATGYSANAALILADYITNSDWGHNATIDWDSVATVADNADDVLGAGVRFETNLLLDRVQSSLDWIKQLQIYAGCFVQELGGTFYLIPDRPAAKVFDVGRDIIRRGSGSLRKGLGRRNRPSDVVALWYDKANNVEKEALAVGGTTGQVSRIPVPGIINYQQALRFAIAQYNHLITEDLSYSCVCRDEALQFELGDVHAITDTENGLEDKYMRLMSKRMDSPGRWKCSYNEYQDAAYSDSVNTDPVTVDTTLPNPNSVPTLAGLTNTRGYEQDTGADDISHYVDVSWTAPAWLFSETIAVQLWTFSGGSLQKMLANLRIDPDETATRIYFPENAKLQTGHTFKSRIRIISRSGIKGAWTTSSSFSPANDPTPPVVDWVLVEKDTRATDTVIITFPSNVPNYVRWVKITESGGDLGSDLKIVDEQDHVFLIPYQTSNTSFSETDGTFDIGTTYTWKVYYVNRDETANGTAASATLTW